MAPASSRLRNFFSDCKDLDSVVVSCEHLVALYQNNKIIHLIIRSCYS